MKNYLFAKNVIGADIEAHERVIQRSLSIKWMSNFSKLFSKKEDSDNFNDNDVIEYENSKKIIKKILSLKNK